MSERTSRSDMRVEEAIQKVPPLVAIGHDRFRRSCPSAFVRCLQPPESFFDTGETANAFGFVVTGRVKLQRHRSNVTRATIDLVTPGRPLCLSRPYAGDPHCCDAVADAANTRVLVVPRHDWLSLMAESEDVSRYFIRALGARTEALCQRIEELSSGRVEQRLGRMLVRLAQQIGEVAEGGIFIPLALSRGDLADLVATTPESATRAMRRLEKGGVVRTLSKGIVVDDVAGLEKLAGLTDDA